MLEFLGLSQNAPFTIALLVMLGIALLEGIATLMWGGLSHVVDSLIPDFDVDVDVDVDVDIDADAHVDGSSIASPDAGLLTPILSWLRIGKVPILVLLVIFLTAFGTSGLLLQSIVNEAIGHLLPAVLAAGAALCIALPCVRVLGGLIARVLPKEETSAVSRETFVGRVATIVLGTAKKGAPTQARLHDENGRTHYVMVEPDVDGESFSQGDDVLLVRVAGPRFRVIHPPSTALLDSDRVHNE